MGGNGGQGKYVCGVGGWGGGEVRSGHGFTAAFLSVCEGSAVCTCVFLGQKRLTAGDQPESLMTAFFLCSLATCFPEQLRPGLKRLCHNTLTPAKNNKTRPGLKRLCHNTLTPAKDNNNKTRPGLKGLCHNTLTPAKQIYTALA